MTFKEHCKTTLLVHRYLYYVEHRSIILDSEYDDLEDAYVNRYGDDLPVGSDSASHYTQEVIDLARTIE